MSDALASFEGHKYLLLTTFRRSGEGVPTAVWFAAGGGALGVFTGPQTGKVKRIRGEGRVRIAPCSFRGRVKGEEQGAAARLVTGETGGAARRRARRRPGDAGALAGDLHFEAAGAGPLRTAGAGNRCMTSWREARSARSCGRRGCRTRS